MMIATFIGSHITNYKRIYFLYETLVSLFAQTRSTSVYLSISFETEELETEFMNIIINDKLLKILFTINIFNYYIRKEKTSQFKHFQLICSQLCQENAYPEWIFFCDDDDTFAKERVELFEKHMSDDVIGIYESHDFGVEHKLRRHEYWCYCVRFCLLCDFFIKLNAYPEVIDNKLCDIVFGEYLRRKYTNIICIDMKTYNYRRENNQDSITGIISNRANFQLRKSIPPTEEKELENYIKDFNEYIEKHILIYKHDFFLRTVVGISFDDILQQEFLADYPVLNLVDIKYIQELYLYHTRLLEMCNNVYDEKFT